MRAILMAGMTLSFALGSAGVLWAKPTTQGQKPVQVQSMAEANRIAMVHELYVGPETARRTADKSKPCPVKPIRVVYAGYGEPNSTVCPDTYANGNFSNPGPDSR